MIQFIVSYFGFLLFARIAENLAQNKSLSKVSLTKIGTIVFSLNTLLLSLYQIDTTLMILVFFIETSALLLLSYVVRLLRKQNFAQEFTLQLDNIILFMTSGLSFRSAFQKSIEESNPSLRFYFQEILRAITHSEQPNSLQNDPSFRAILEELKKVDRNTHKAIERLRALRRKIRVQQNFRRKSGQVTRQIKAQAVILCGMYFVLLFIFLIRGGLNQHLSLLLLSLFIFGCGLFFTFLIGKNYQWKI